MESTNRKENNVLKKKKINIFKRFSNRISEYFHKSKTTNLVANGDSNLSRSCLDDLPVTSMSHDNLKLNDKSKSKRNVFEDSLNIPKINDRCLSEGDLTREEGQFYSQGSSPKACTSGAFESNTNESTRTESKHENILNNTKKHMFKNELALKLRGKNPAKDNESEHSKTPESPTGLYQAQSGTSPSRNLFSDTRTPRSMSSLSHSSNSLLSGNTTNIYGTSDGDSMSRSVIDSHDDIGIVVDLATPMSKTTTAALLDSTAARQKIAASKARRVRPKAITNVVSDKESSAKDSVGQFSPVRDKRDILEEISEEDCTVSSNVLVNTEDSDEVGVQAIIAVENTKLLSEEEKRHHGIKEIINHPDGADDDTKMMSMHKTQIQTNDHLSSGTEKSEESSNVSVNHVTSNEETRSSTVTLRRPRIEIVHRHSPGMDWHDNSKPAGTKNSDQSPDKKNIDQSPGTETSDQSPNTKNSDQSPDTKNSDKYPGAKNIDQSPGMKTSDQSPNTKNSDQSPDIKNSDQYPGAKNIDQSPGMKTSDQSSSTKIDVQSPGTKTSDQSPCTKTSDQSSSTKTSDQSSSTKTNVQSPGTKTSDQSPGTKTSDQSSSTKTNVQSPATQTSDQSPCTKTSDKSSSTKTHVQSPGTLISAQSPGTKNSNQYLDTETSDQSSSTKTSVQSPGTKNSDKSSGTAKVVHIKLPNTDKKFFGTINHERSKSPGAHSKLPSTNECDQSPGTDSHDHCKVPGTAKVEQVEQIKRSKSQKNDSNLSSTDNLDQSSSSDKNYKGPSTENTDLNSSLGPHRKSPVTNKVIDSSDVSGNNVAAIVVETRPSIVSLHKPRIQADHSQPPGTDKVEPKFNVKLRATGINILSGKDNQYTSHNPSKEETHSGVRPSTDLRGQTLSLPATDHNAHNNTTGNNIDKRSSRVLNLLKNFES